MHAIYLSCATLSCATLLLAADPALAGSELRVDGGATVNTALMQFQSDLLRVPVVRPRTTETTALRIRCAGLQDRLDDQADAADRWGETREADIVERDETIAQLRQVIQQLTDATYEQRSELYRRGWRDPAPDQHETDADDLNALDMHDLNALDPTTRRSK